MKPVISAAAQQGFLPALCAISFFVSVVNESPIPPVHS
jgi:hypothetical protein